jgi:hypothetical protein
MRQQAVRQVLLLGFNVLFADIDVAIVSNPLPYMILENVDYVHTVNQVCNRYVYSYMCIINCLCNLSILIILILFYIFNRFRYYFKGPTGTTATVPSSTREIQAFISCDPIPRLLTCSVRLSHPLPGFA